MVRRSIAEAVIGYRVSGIGKRYARYPIPDTLYPFEKEKRAVVEGGGLALEDVEAVGEEGGGGLGGEVGGEEGAELAGESGDAEHVVGAGAELRETIGVEGEPLAGGEVGGLGIDGVRLDAEGEIDAVGEGLGVGIVVATEQERGGMPGVDDLHRAS